MEHERVTWSAVEDPRIQDSSAEVDAEVAVPAHLREAVVDPNATEVGLQFRDSCVAPVGVVLLAAVSSRGRDTAVVGELRVDTSGDQRASAIGSWQRSQQLRRLEVTRRHHAREDVVPRRRVTRHPPLAAEQCDEVAPGPRHRRPTFGRSRVVSDGCEVRRQVRGAAPGGPMQAEEGCQLVGRCHGDDFARLHVAAAAREVGCGRSKPEGAQHPAADTDPEQPTGGLGPAPFAVGVGRGRRERMQRLIDVVAVGVAEACGHPRHHGPPLDPEQPTREHGVPPDVVLLRGHRPRDGQRPARDVVEQILSWADIDSDVPPGPG